MEVDASPDEVLRRVREAVDAWGGEWQSEGERGGKLILPVSAGVRRGWMGFEVSVEPPRDGGDEASELVLRRAQDHLQVDRATVMVLLLALLGALLFLVVPFVPRLLPLLPIGFVLTVAGWLFVVARLRNSGPDEFLEQLSSASEPEPAPS